MAGRKKNRVKKTNIVLKMIPAKKVYSFVGPRNMIFSIISVFLFFGLILGAHFKMAHTRIREGLLLKVTFKGDPGVGEQLNRKGRDFLINKKIISVKSPDILEDTYNFYTNIPEVKRVIHTRRVMPDTLEVKLELREPFVRVKGVFFDADGCRLSRKYNTSKKAKTIPVIKGLNFPSQLSPGDVWENIFFQEALNALEKVGEKIDIKSITIPAQRTRRNSGGIALETRKGIKIFWGRVFREGMASEVSDDHKLRNLEEAMKIISARYRHIEYVDISHNKPVISPKRI